MPRWQGKSKGTPLGYRIFFFICKTFGVFPAYFVLRVVAFYYFIFSWKTSIPIYHYFRQRHHLGPIHSFLNIYRNYFLLGQTLLDKVIVLAGVKNPFTYHFDGADHLKKIVALGKGGVLLSAHVGNWEMAGHHLEQLQTPVNIVMYDGEHQQIKKFMDAVTGKRNFKIIVIREDLTHVYAIGEALANNELVCLHADRFLEGNKTILRKFLGDPALFPGGPFSLAAGFDVPVSIVFAFKETSRHYHYFGSSLFQRQASEKKSDFVERLADAFVAELEEKVNAYPEQWFNYYNFWEISGNTHP